MESIEEQILNPWVSMWTKPRATIQQIIDTKPQRLVLLLAAAAGFGQVLDRASINNFGDRVDWPVIFLVAAVGGPIAGVIGLYLSGALIHWTGTWIGGKTSAENIRAAIAWSSVPMLWALVLWIPELALFGQELFTAETPVIDADTTLNSAFLAFGVVEVTIGIWTLIVYLKCLGQVQGFSAWKALGNSILAGLVIIVPILIIAIAIGLSTE